MVGKSLHRLQTLVLIVVSLLLSIGLVEPAFAATPSSQPLRGERDINNEYYFFDDNKIVGSAGEYEENVAFKKVADENGQAIYEIDGDTWKAAGLEEDKSSGLEEGSGSEGSAGSNECLTIPAKRWNPETEKKDENKAALRIAVDKRGNGEVDVTGDRHQKSGIDLEGDLSPGNDYGTFRWGNTTESYKKTAKDIPENSDGATINFEDRRPYEVVAAGALGSMAYLGDEGSLTCTYEFYNYFWRFITRYDAKNLQPGPLAGKLLGEPGMKFSDWANNADHRLQYMAYRENARNNIINHCSEKIDMYECINKIDATRKTCQAQAIGKSEDATQQTLNNVRSDYWKDQTDEKKFVECFAAKTEHVTDEYFADKKDQELFAQKIVDTTVFPPSLNPTAAEKVTRDPAPDDTQCSIGMLGWILCPVLSFIASVNDKVYDILKNWLVLAPFQTSDGGSNAAAYDTWQKFRDIANVMFIVAFVAIIYAQITGRASSEYGLRRRMPRIIIVALLVNISYILCGVLVDIINVTGDSLFRLLVNTTIEGSGVSQYATWEKIVANVTLAGGAAAGTLALLGNLAALVPMLLAAFIAMVTTFLVLLFRQAAIILLVILSPLAFAMLVLPSTEKWFNKWKDFFLQLLFIYPVFALVFGGSNMAAEIIRGSAEESGEVLLSIFSLAVQVLPLFLIPLILKLGSSVANRFTGILDRQSGKGFIGGLKQGASEFRDDRKVQQQTRAASGRGGALFAYGSLIRANQRRQTKGLYAKSMASKNTAQYVGTSKLGGLAAQGSAGGGLLTAANLKQAAKDALRKEAHKAEQENHEAELVKIENGDHRDLDQLMEAAIPGNDDGHRSDRSASIQKVVESGDVGKIDKLVDNVAKLTEFEREVLADAIEKSGIQGKAAHLDASATEAIRNNTVGGGSASLYRSAVERGNYSAETVASQDAHALTNLAGSGITTAQVEEIRSHFRAAKANGKLNSRMSYATRSAGDRHFGGSS